MSTALSNWILDFLTSRPKRVGIGSRTSSAGAPQGCVFSPLLFTPSSADESSYPEEINNLAESCRVNDVLLDVNKTKELIVYLRTAETHLSTSGELRWSR